MDRRRYLLWAFPASLIMHALIIALLVYGLPRAPLPQQEEQAINVTLVPPTVLPKAKTASLPSSMDPKAEKPLEPKAKNPTQKQPPRPARIEVLKPVFRFGKKDTGASPMSPASDERPDANDAPNPAKGTESARDVQQQATSNLDRSKQLTNKKGDSARASDLQTAAAPTPLNTPRNDGEISLPALAKPPQPRPANLQKLGFAKASKAGTGGAVRPSSTDMSVATSERYSGLPGVRGLPSRGTTRDLLPATSMSEVPRDQRVAKLCASALQRQLVGASYFPDLVPLVPLKQGNVLDVPDTAFRTSETWYDLSFRCEVDTGATTVLSMGFRVGAAIPPEEWARLGLP